MTPGGVIDKGIGAAVTSIQNTGLLGALIVVLVASVLVLEKYLFRPRRAEARIEMIEQRGLREKELSAAVEAAKSIQGATQAAQAASASAQETSKVAAQMVEKLTDAWERVEAQIKRPTI